MPRIPFKIIPKSIEPRAAALKAALDAVPLQTRAWLHKGGELFNSRVAATVANQTPISRREFFRDAGRLRKDALRDRRDQVVDAHGDLLDKMWDIRTEGGRYYDHSEAHDFDEAYGLVGHVPEMPSNDPSLEMMNKTVSDLGIMRDDLYDRISRPSILDRMREGSDMLENPEETVVQKLAPALPSRSRRALIKSLLGRR